MFQRRRCLNIMVIYMYVVPGWGQMSPWCPFLFRITDIQSYCPFPTRFSLNAILTVFPIQTHRPPMLTLLKNMSRSSQGHDLFYIHCSIGVIDASCHVLLKSVNQFWRRKFLKGFYHIWAWRPSWQSVLDYL